MVVFPAMHRSWASRHASGLVLGLLLAFSTRTALAAVPVSLPPGESAAQWEHAFALGGLVAGPAGEGTWIQLVAAGDHWLLRVKDAAGQVHEARVVAPRSQQEREDTIWLAMSLLKPAAGGATWSDVKMIEALPTPRPPPRPAPTPRPQPKVEVPTPPPPPPPPPEPVSPIQPSPEAVARVVRPAGLPWWARAGGGAGWRAETGIAADIHAAAGVVPADHVLLGLGLDLEPGIQLGLGNERRIGSFDVTGLVGYTVGASIRPALALVGGVSVRSFSEDGAPRGSAPVPILGADLSVAFPLSERVRVAPYAALRYDTRAIRFAVGDDVVSELAPLELRGGVTVQLTGNLD